ncbi:UNVERIFIED_CONTAM: hypothetical protein ABIC26_003960 [Paenibacillus sp. PvR008]
MLCGMYTPSPIWKKVVKHTCRLRMLDSAELTQKEE